ncbi:MAG: glycerol dehydratase reactivase beta/small subunit family protein [Anaerovoracaceae bacterium]
MTNEINKHRITVLCATDLAIGKEICYGIEEEGVPYKLVYAEKAFEEAAKLLVTSGLGTLIAVEKTWVAVFYSGLKSNNAFLKYNIKDKDNTRKDGNTLLRTAGKNAARIVKRKILII